MYESIYLFINIFISAKVSGRRVVSVVWAIYRVRVERESRKFGLIN